LHCLYDTTRYSLIVVEVKLGYLVAEERIKTIDREFVTSAKKI